jgi:methylenetetrahydrofolate reductase (NADPH)
LENNLFIYYVRGDEMGFIDSLKNGKFVILCEIDPPKGIDTSGLFEKADLLKGRVDALLVTDMPSAVMKIGSLTVSYLLKGRGFDAIYHLSCRDRNALALQSDLLSAAALGIENVYITEGDDITLGDHPRSKPVNEISADEFLGIVKKLQEGHDYAGNELEGVPRFNVGTLLNSNAQGSAIDDEFAKMEERVKQGVAYFITPAIFDLKSFEKFMKRVRSNYKVPVIAELILLKSVATARFLNRHVPNVTVPDAIIDRLYSAGDKVMESITITAELIRGLKNLCDGVHILALGWESKLPDFLDAVGG